MITRCWKFAGSVQHTQSDHIPFIKVEWNDHGFIKEFDWFHYCPRELIQEGKEYRYKWAKEALYKALDVSSFSEEDEEIFHDFLDATAKKFDDDNPFYQKNNFTTRAKSLGVYPPSKHYADLGAKAAIFGLGSCPWCNSKMKEKDKSYVAVCEKDKEHIVEWLPWPG